MIEIIPFDLEKAKDFKYDGIENNISGSDISRIAEWYSNLGCGYIGIVDGYIVGMGGVFKMWNEWGSAWLFLNKKAKNHRVGVFKMILSKMNELVKSNGIKILSVQCLDESSEANRLLNHLGFVKNKEFKMALYGRQI